MSVDLVEGQQLALRLGGRVSSVCGRGYELIDCEEGVVSGVLSAVVRGVDFSGGENCTAMHLKCSIRNHYKLISYMLVLTWVTH